MHFQLMCISMPKYPSPRQLSVPHLKIQKRKNPPKATKPISLSYSVFPFFLPFSILETQNAVKPNLFHFCNILVSYFVDKRPYVETSTAHTTSRNDDSRFLDSTIFSSLPFLGFLSLPPPSFFLHYLYSTLSLPFPHTSSPSSLLDSSSMYFNENQCTVLQRHWMIRIKRIFGRRK